MSGQQKHSDGHVEAAIQHAERYIAKHANDVAPGVGSVEVGIMHTLVDALMKTDHPTPPAAAAADVREAVIDIDVSRIGHYISRAACDVTVCPECQGEVTSWYCDTCRNSGKVRPREEATESEVRAAAYAMYSAECRRQGMPGPLKSINEPGWSERTWSDVARAALEAAREVHS